MAAARPVRDGSRQGACPAVRCRHSGGCRRFAGFRRLGPGAALFLSSLLFAVAHSSIYRLLPTFTLGLLLGYCALRSRSLIPGMIIHAINNSLLVTLVHVPELAKKLGMNDLEYVPWSWSLGMGLVTCLGMVLIFRDKPEPELKVTPSAD